MNTKPTQYDKVNKTVTSLSQGILDVFGENLVGIYLTGSLSYGDFNPESSDIDLSVIIKTPASESEIEKLKSLHEEIEKQYPEWKERIESSYTPIEMLKSVMPPGARPYLGEGKFYELADYGNEWIINLYFLYHHGITIVGPEFKELMRPVNIEDVQDASRRDLFREWEPKLKEPEWLDNPHYQSYLVMNLCRILNTVLNARVTSKKKSALWVKERYPEWKNLIEEAESWHYGISMNKKEQTLEFLRFVIEKVGKS